MRERDATYLADRIGEQLNQSGFRNLIDTVEARLDNLTHVWVVEVRIHRSGARGEWAVHQTIYDKRAAQEVLVFMQAISWAETMREQNISFIPEVKS